MPRRIAPSSPRTRQQDPGGVGVETPGCFRVEPRGPEYRKLWSWPSVLDIEPDVDGTYAIWSRRSTPAWSAALCPSELL
jgi:hypothetical protein